ncbi:MAG: serine hydroxymethyltransferase [Desulfurococcales archaeon]|nr:serine hydroxymethyltransferase [Desulfurococcales archaeon]
MSLEEINKLFEIVSSHNEWRLRKTVNLIASENVMSRTAWLAYISDFEHRYAEGKPGKRYYEGTTYIDILEPWANDLMAKLTHAKYADVRPTSGTISNAGIFRVLGSVGDKALIAPVQAGAHVSHTKFGTLGALGIQQVEMPYDSDSMNVDIDKAVKMVEEVKPKFIVMGGSVYLFPHPVKELSEAAKAVGSKIVYDAAHVLGLIIGGAWRNPLDYGADIITASTHKTFPGPQGGFYGVRDDEEMFKAIYKTIFPYFLSNHHLHHIPALIVTALEMENYGKEYAKQVVKNARKLAESLVEAGFKVLGEHLGYTQSHQVVIDVREQGGGHKAAKTLQEANIIVNKNLLPYDPPSAIKDPSGLRLGVQEMTRFGMKEEDMGQIALFFKKILIDRAEPKEVASEVTEFRSGFTRVKFSFDREGIEFNNTVIDLVK